MVPTETVDKDGRLTTGVIWQPVENVQRPTGKLLHPPLPELRPLFERFAALFPSLHDTADGWEFGFRRERNYAYEILLWARAADVFEKLTAGRMLSNEKKWDIARVIFVCMSSDREVVRFIVRPLTVTKKRLEKIIAAFYCDGRGMDPALYAGLALWEVWRVVNPGRYPTGQLNEPLSEFLRGYIRQRLESQPT
jgi:hypothetical protein